VGVIAMRKKDKDKIIEKVINGDIENKEEKEIYLEYLNNMMNNLIKQNKEDKKDNLKNIFKDWLKNYKSFRSVKDGYIIYHGFLPGFVDLISVSALVAFVIEILTSHTFISLTILLFMQSIPIIISLVKSIFKNYLSSRKQTRLNFAERKQELEDEIKEVSKLQFQEEKEQDMVKETYSHEERFLLDSKEKTKTYERITTLIIKVKKIENKEIQKRLAFELEKVLHVFDDARIKFENLSPNAEYLLLQDKIKIENFVEVELEKIENEIDQMIVKETRMEEDKEIVKQLSDELGRITRNI